jgi:hypothetical protein
MTKSLYLLTVLFFVKLSTFGQDSNDNAYLLRKHKDKDSIWTVSNTGCYYMANTGMKENHFGWFQSKDLQIKQTDIFYFEAETFGSFQLVFELKPPTKLINLDTVSKINHQLINHFYGYARTHFANKNNTIDILSGIVSFNKIDGENILIDGTINIDTKNPVTHQEIVFKKYNLKIHGLTELLENERKEKIEKEKQQKKQMGAYGLASNERGKFYDSIFNLKKYPNNSLKVRINKKTSFDFTLDNSYILINASLTDSAKQDLTELLGGNILATIQGNKKVFVFHSFYDPVKNTIDDETNYSLSIEIDSIIIGKTYQTSEFAAKLAFWHYGPHGSTIISKEKKGTLTITASNDNQISGTLSLEFKNIDNTKFSLNGNFELPKMKLSDISDLESKIKLKLIKYYSEE